MSKTEKLQVLVADDEESFLRVLTTALEATDRFTVFPCESGDEAINALMRSQYDLLILDHKMPGMTGLNVLQWLHEQKSEVPVIMLTAAGSESIAVEAMKLGAYDYIRKEHFDRDHFPMVVLGVFERYLFRKEKELLAGSEKARERDLETLEMLRTSLSAIAHVATTTLNVIKSLVDEGEQSVQLFLSGEGLDQYQVLQKKIRFEIQVLDSVNDSMTDLSKAMENYYGEMQSARRLKTEPGFDPSTVRESVTRLP